MMEPEARIAALKTAAVQATTIVQDAWAEMEHGTVPIAFEAIAYDHVLQALIQDLHDEEANR